jgi:hypothetical protein
MRPLHWLSGSPATEYERFMISMNKHCIMPFMQDSGNDRPCALCKQPFRHWYSLDDLLWMRLRLRVSDMACLDCVAKKLKRPFRLSDFPDCGINYSIRRALDLLSRGLSVNGRHSQEVKVIIEANRVFW